jgi:hypothetical protein
MSMFTHKINNSYVDDSGLAIGGQSTYTGTLEKGVDTSLAVGVTDQPVLIAWTAANVQSEVFYASAAARIKTNSATVPGTTINLTPGQTIVWGHDFLAANPIPADVTELFISNTDATNSAIIKIRVLST